MPGKKKQDDKPEIIYSKSESFENLKAVQNMALNKKGKNDDIEPDIPLFLKAEELKGKLCGLYSDKEGVTKRVNVMGSVRIDGKTLKPKVGEEFESDVQND